MESPNNHNKLPCAWALILKIISLMTLLGFRNARYKVIIRILHIQVLDKHSLCILLTG